MTKVHVVHFGFHKGGRYENTQEECLIVLVDNFDFPIKKVKVMLEYEANHIFYQEEDHGYDFRLEFPFVKSEKFYTKELVDLLGEDFSVAEDDEYDKYGDNYHYRGCYGYFDFDSKNYREEFYYEGVFRMSNLNTKREWGVIPNFSSFRESPIGIAYIQGLIDQREKDLVIIKEERDKYWELYRKYSDNRRNAQNKES